ncbi:MAG: hypothetical protein ACD_52C00027G0005 [uncultured bacterium]|uniref:Uncharacterized protein n=1 Tax=Candidatus Curtissbacteria bacterium RIFOXYA1_FULL_41_14 TaxID=1797737 RepID=A0A1F5HBW1_9BACT|nr:MAG: hypothetical protein ACD_52C00027G0005 [uncultured bacterium]OGD93367.1 MAG: hypothetical protein A3E14_03965 [Candidatus Curtissbacteria bacterium RIFCSPHIGHO2_12_FULL_41_13]OGE01674.1 MAG: hypothetical protein A2196_02200 [Candidatus Curtissbacteria bacterium RIFOXYA1_FULL_41_14]OGE08672.1 MAG: hypothetical protein A2615_03995 [Candidatus Curtissbacteria bacterium RIFOXYD1_FULL_41_36]OGE11910.1 MAG: hypothetical protein A3J89_02830 [Candidatus Curtissbacteria bacterium RIFOXYB12_FULL_
MAKTNSQSSNFVAKTKGFITGRKKLAAILILIIVILGFGLWRFLGDKGQQPQYQTAQVERGTIVSSVSASGQVISSNLVNITSSSTGIVKDVFVTDGEKITSGQKILEITLDQAGQAKNAQAYSSYLQAKTNLDAANANAYSLRSKKDTAWKKFYDLATNTQYQNSDETPREDMRNSSAEFQSDQADWLAAEAKYKNQTAVISQAQQAASSAWLSYEQSSPIVTSPMSGTIDNITYVPGMILAQQTSTTNNANQRVAVVKNESTPIISVNLSEIDVPKVKVNQKATVTFDSITDKTFTGKVISVDRIGVTTSGVTSYPAVIQIDTDNQEILPNMAATANVIIETKDNVLSVPASAIQNTTGQTTVNILKNGQPQEVSVVTGISSSAQTEIVSGLSEGETVVVQTTTQQGQGSNQGTSPFSTFGGGGGRFIQGR